MIYKHTVAMKATKRQFVDDLKEPLKQMGRKDETWGDWSQFHYITACDDFGCVGNYDAISPNTIFIDHYNPKLFLALAAMTDNENGNTGEWWKCIDDNWINFTEEKIYRQANNSKDFTLINNLNHNYEVKYLKNLFTKATKEEIFARFAKKGNDEKKVCFLSNGTKERGDKIIAELVRLGGNNRGYTGDDRRSYYFIGEDNDIGADAFIPEGYTLTELPIEVRTRVKLNVGDAIKVRKGSRYKTVGESDWRHEVWGSTMITLNRDIQYIFRIQGDLIYVDEKNYKGNHYLIVERENIELVKSEITEIKMKNRILTPQNATRIINIACSTWKPKLAEKWATNIVLDKNTEISEEFYEEMRRACTTEQNTLFDEIFGKDEQLIHVSELKIGESMIVCDGPSGRWNGTIVSRIWTDDNDDAVYVNMNNTSCTWTPNPQFKGKKVKLTITHEEVK